MKSVIVKKSKINKKGVFATKNFKKGKIVLKWRPKLINPAQAEKLKSKYKKYIFKIRGRYFLMQPPERYVNHSCEANTRAKDHTDIAIRNIRKGEEITSNYSSDPTPFAPFGCACGSKSCKNLIK